MPRKKPARAESENVTYRELRNTPGRVWERLEADEPLALVADGRPRALLIPLIDGDVRAAYEAFVRGRALLAAARIRKQAAAARTGPMGLKEVNDLIARTRRAREATRRGR
jgi:hypothetical protein